MSSMESLLPKALEDIRWLAAIPGGRGSCTTQERQAGEYVVQELARIGACDARLEAVRGAPSTYRPFALAFSAALLGIVLSWALPGRGSALLAALLNALGAWGMLAETDLASSWLGALLPAGESINAMGRMPAAGEARRRLVVCAHLDTHRTPVFFSSPAWNRAFSALVGTAFASMPAAALAYLAGGLFAWEAARWLGLAAGALQALALALCLHADLTPYSPGANDNASGVGVALALAARLASQPLERSEVWLLFTGCEETGAAGMRAFLDAHPASQDKPDFFLVLDQVGIGVQGVLTRDGLIRKRRTHPLALQVARNASEKLPQVGMDWREGVAYTDALAATRRGLPALSLSALPSPGGDQDAHWHRLSDVMEHIDPGAVSDAIALAWQVLLEADGVGAWAAG